MKRHWIIAVATCLLVVGAKEQITVQLPSGARVSIGPPSQSVETAAGAPGVLTPETIFEVKLLTPVSSGKAKPRKKVTAVMTQKVVSGDETIVPLNSKVTGHVTEVQKCDGAHPEARLGLVFDQIALKHGKTLAFVGVIDNVSVEDRPWYVTTGNCPLPSPFECTVHYVGPNGHDPDYFAVYKYRYTDTGRGILISSQKRNIDLGYDIRLLVKVVPAKP